MLRALLGSLALVRLLRYAVQPSIVQEPSGKLSSWFLTESCILDESRKLCHHLDQLNVTGEFVDPSLWKSATF